ncbi:MAG TPA: Gfo/Idh/MocA family oxidoreductase [bacterium]|nr:Gfo/Idh/MocA family oxidoreductase [bacterium]
METYCAAIVGLSEIGAARSQAAPAPVLGEAQPHSHAAAYAAIPRTTVVAVCDVVPDLLERFQQQWGDVFPEARRYTDYREMLSRERIDLLSVATPDDRHAQIVVDAAESGVKGILCEKPIATTLAEADRMIAACAGRRIPLLINHTRRWFPEFVEARRLVRANAIGRLRRVVAIHGGPRAMLFRMGTHLVDMVCFYAESEPESVSGELDDEHRHYGPRYAGDGGRDGATDPGYSAYVRFQSGVRASLTASKQTMYTFELDLIGAAGRIRVGAHVGEIWQAFGDGAPALRPLRPPYTTRGDMGAAVAELLGLIEHGGSGSSTGEDGRRALSILLGILQSSDTGGGPVSFPVHDR